jgi:hypothetical protein
MDVPEADAAEQQQTLGEAARTDEVDIEAPEADAAEQLTPVGRSQWVAERSASIEADEADASDQAAVVEDDDDEYR